MTRENQLNRSLSEIFISTRGQPVDLDGLAIHPSYRIVAPSGSKLRITIIESHSDRPQALRLKTRDGYFKIGEHKLKEVSIWSDVYEGPVDVEFISDSGKDGSLLFWNAWRWSDGSVLSGVGNFGVIVEETPGEVYLRFSEGPGEPMFDALVVSVDTKVP